MCNDSEANGLTYIRTGSVGVCQLQQLSQKGIWCAVQPEHSLCFECSQKRGEMLTLADVQW